MIISHKLKYIFITVPKCATHTLFNILQKHYEGKRYKSIHHNQIPKEYEKYYIFTCVRNPYERAVSGWWSTCISGKRLHAECPDPTNFESFIEWGLVNKIQHPTLLSQSHQLRFTKPNYHIYMEKFQDDFKKLPFYIGLPEAFPVLNATRYVREPWKTYMTSKAIEVINQFWREDFMQFKYERL